MCICAESQAVSLRVPSLQLCLSCPLWHLNAELAWTPGGRCRLAPRSLLRSPASTVALIQTFSPRKITLLELIDVLQTCHLEGSVSHQMIIISQITSNKTVYRVCIYCACVYIFVHFYNGFLHLILWCSEVCLNLVKNKKLLRKPNPVTYCSFYRELCPNKHADLQCYANFTL